MRNWSWLMRLAAAVWMAWLGLIGLMFGMLRLGAWHPHFLPVTAVLAVLLGAGLSLLILGTGPFPQSWRLWPKPPTRRVLCYASAKLLREEAESMVPNIDPERVRKLAGWGLMQNDRASFVGWSPQPSAYCSEIRLCPIRNADHGLGSAKSAFHIV